MRRIGFFMLALGILAAMCGCQYSVRVLDKGTFTNGTEELLSDETDVDYALNDGTTVESETIVDTDGVIVRVLGLENSTTSPSLQMVFDKGNNDSIDFVADYVIVDGWQVTGMVLPPSDSGTLIFRNCARDYSKFTGYLSISTGLLVECGLLDQIHEIEFGYQLFGRTNSLLLTEGVYSTTTSNGEKEPDDLVCDGPVLLDENGIKIQLYSFERGIYLDEDCVDLILYVENNSERRIEVVMGDAVKYDATGSDDEGETETTGSVVPRVEKGHKHEASVPLSNELDVCAGLRALSGLQTADVGNVVSLSDEEELSFSLKVYDYEEYDSYDPPNPLYDETVTLTTKDMFTPG